MNIQISGLKELEQAMRQLPDKLQQRPLRAAVNAAAQVVKKQARANVPVDTGLLKKDIIVTRSRRRSAPGRETYLVMVREKKKKYADTRRNRRANRVGKTYTVQGDAYYWRFLEFGTVKMPARPFMRRAFENTKNQQIDALKTKLSESIEKLARELR